MSLSVEKCTDKEYEGFYPAFGGDIEEIQNLREKDILYCIEHWPDLKLLGNPKKPI